MYPFPLSRLFIATCGLVTAFSAAAADEASDAASGNDGDKLANVTVTASPLTSDADSLATIVDSVNKDEILRQGGANLADALRDVPGVTGTSFASGASRPVIRGFDASRIKVMEDGVSAGDVSDIGPDHGVPVDPLSAQRIEVVRGAATLRYGSQAIGGVVNAINNRVPLELPEDKLSGEVTSSYDSVSDGREGSALVDGRVGQFALHADGFARHTNDYDTPHGTLDNSFYHGDGYSAGGSYFFGQNNDNRIGLAGVHYDAKYGIPGEDTYIDMKQTKELFSSSFAINRGAFQTLNVDGGYADYHHSERDPDGTPESTFKNKEVDSRAEALFGQVGMLSRSALGIQIQHRDFSALGEGQDYLLPTTTKSYAAFGFTELPFTQQLRLQAGARLEHTEVDGTTGDEVDHSPSFNPVSGSLGLVYDQTAAITWGLTLSSTGRAPAQTELYAHGGHDGPETYETGDPDLSIERANSVEGTFRFHTDRVRLESSLWVAKFNNYIYGDLTGRTCDDDGVCSTGGDGDLKELNYVQRDATFRGAEAKATGILYHGGYGDLQAQLMGDYVRATLSGGDDVPRIPPWHLGTGLDWSVASVDTGVFLKYSAKQDHVGTAGTTTKDFVSLDAHVGWTPLASRPGLEVMLVGHNLTDSVQRNAVALNKDEVVLPGRNVQLTVRATF